MQVENLTTGDATGKAVTIVRTHLGPKQTRLGDAFSLGWGEEVAFNEVDLTLKLKNATCAYAGHRFEELGDEYRVLLEVGLEGHKETTNLSWHERNHPPGRVLITHGYVFEVLGCRTGHFHRERSVKLRVTRSLSEQ